MRSRIALITAGVAAASPAVAQLPAAARDTTTLGAVVVTATRVPLERAAVPASVSVVTGEQLRTLGVTHIADALRQVPGVYLAQSGSFGAQTGLFLRGGESKYVKVLVDGVPVNDAGGAFDFGTLTVDNVDRIEVVRGPASVLYGSDAVTGVVQIFTRRGAGAPRVEASGRAGTYASRDADAAVRGGTSATTYSVDVARHATDGAYAFNSGYASNVLSGLLSIAPDQATELRVSARYTDYKFHYPTNSAGAVVDSNAFRTEDKTQLGIEVGRKFSPSAEARLSLNLHEADGGTDDRADGRSSSSYVSLDRSRRRSADLRVNFAPLASQVLTLGAAIERQDGRSQSQSLSSFGLFTSEFAPSRINRALYAQLLARAAGERVTVTLGGRRDDNERFGVFGTWRAAANVRVVGATHIRAAAGTAFREPTFFEQLASGGTVGNRSLHPERARSSEAAIDQGLLGGRLQLGVTAFRQRFRDMIDYTGSPAVSGAPNYYNVARARADGVEAEVRAEPVRGLTTDASYTRLNARVITPGFDTTAAGLYSPGSRLVRRPAHSAALGVGYRAAAGAVDVRASRVGDRADRNYSTFPARPVTLGWYTKLDLGGELRAPRSAVRGNDVALTLRVENATDANYQSVAGFEVPGRTVLVGARVGAR